MLVGAGQLFEHSKVKQFILTSPYQFYLTGSRYFQTNSLGSDWDFFTGVTFSTPQLRQDLKALGFNQLQFTNYSDMLCSEVYRFKESNFSVDIQIVKDASLKQRIQENIFNSPQTLKYYKSLRKSERPAYWDFMYTCATGKKIYQERPEKHRWVTPNVPSIISEMP